MRRATCPWCGREVETDLMEGSDPMCDDCRDEMLRLIERMRMTKDSIRPREKRSGRFVNCGVCGREVRLSEMREHMHSEHYDVLSAYAAERKRPPTSYSPTSYWQISMAMGAPKSRTS